MDSISIFVKGAYDRYSGNAGLAAIVTDGLRVVEIAGRPKKVSVNSPAFYALREALELDWVEKSDLPVNVYTDLQLLPNTITNWMPSGGLRGLKAKSSNLPYKEIIREICQAIAQRKGKTTISWVRNSEGGRVMAQATFIAQSMAARQSVLRYEGPLDGSTYSMGDFKPPCDQGFIYEERNLLQMRGVMECISSANDLKTQNSAISSPAS